LQECFKGTPGSPETEEGGSGERGRGREKTFRKGKIWTKKGTEVVQGGGKVRIRRALRFEGGSWEFRKKNLTRCPLLWGKDRQNWTRKKGHEGKSFNQEKIWGPWEGQGEVKKERGKKRGLSGLSKKRGGRANSRSVKKNKNVKKGKLMGKTNSL